MSDREIFAYCNLEDTFKVWSLVYTWRYPLHRFTPGWVVSVVGQVAFAGKRGKPRPCRAARRSALSEEPAVWGGLTVETFLEHVNREDVPGHPQSCFPSEDRGGVSNASGARLRNEHPQRGAARWDGRNPSSAQAPACSSHRFWLHGNQSLNLHNVWFKKKKKFISYSYAMKTNQIRVFSAQLTLHAVLHTPLGCFCWLCLLFEVTCIVTSNLQTYNTKVMKTDNAIYFALMSLRQW